MATQQQTFGERLAAARLALDGRPNQADVARMVGVAVSTYASWEQGKSIPHRAHLLKAAEVLRVSPAYLLLDDQLENNGAPDDANWRLRLVERRLATLVDAVEQNVKVQTAVRDLAQANVGRLAAMDDRLQAIEELLRSQPRRRQTP